MSESATPNELWRHFANYLNIISAGLFTAACATAPIAYISNASISGWTIADTIVILVMGSWFFHGMAQVVLFTLVSR